MRMEPVASGVPVRAERVLVTRSLFVRACLLGARRESSCHEILVCERERSAGAR